MLCEEKAEVWETVSVETIRDSSEKKTPSCRVCWAAGPLLLVAFFLGWLLLASLWIGLMNVLSTNTPVKFLLGNSLHKVPIMVLQGLWSGCYFPLPVHQFYLFSLTFIAKVTASLPSPSPNIHYLFQLEALSSSESVCSCQEQPERDMEAPKSLP